MRTPDETTTAKQCINLYIAVMCLINTKSFYHVFLRVKRQGRCNVIYNFYLKWVAFYSEHGLGNTKYHINRTTDASSFS